VVRECSKQRFQVSEEAAGELFIRATQGHTMKTVKEEGLMQKIEHNNLRYCIHGTYKQAIDGIRATGLNRMARNHIHLSPSIPDMDTVISGMRFSCDTVVVIDLIAARDNGGIDFFLSSNNVILSPGLGTTGAIPPQYIVGIYDKRDYIRHTKEGGFMNLPPTQVPTTAATARVPVARVPVARVPVAAVAAPAPIVLAESVASAGVARDDAHIEGSMKSDKKNLYYCVIDFEATCLRDSQISNQEIIEFPAVFINAETLSAEFEFHSYVKPVRNAMLSEFCTELTGIEQATVDAAPEFGRVFFQFCSFLAEHGLAGGKTRTRASGDVMPPREIIFVTHGDWDLKTMLPQQCQVSNMKVPSEFKRWVNLKNVYKDWETQREAEKKGHKKKSSRRGLGMAHMLTYLDMELVGRHHSGIDDTRNIARMLVELCRRGAVVKCPAFPV
jgi:ERI1 exoribonuclease 3